MRNNLVENSGAFFILRRSPIQESSWVERCSFCATLVNGVGQKSEQLSRLEGISSQKLQQRGVLIPVFTP